MKDELIGVFGDVELSAADLRSLAKCSEIGCTENHETGDRVVPLKCPYCEEPVQAMWRNAAGTVVFYCATGCKKQIGYVRS